MRSFFGKIVGKSLVRLVGGSFQGLCEFKGLLAKEPITEAMLFPFGEVLFIDGAGVEFGREESFDLGKLVEPRENGFALFVVLDAAVELVTDGVREAADFSIVSGGE